MNEININVENYPDDTDLLIPFSVSYREGGDYDISCYADSLEIVGEYAERFGNSIFSNEAIAFLKDRLDGVFAPKGYELQIEDDRVYFLENTVDGGNIAVNSRDALEYTNLCEIDLTEAAELGQEAFVCIEDEKIVSVAVENYTHKGETEIAVETAPAYRRRGLAKAASAALCNDIVNTGGSVTWHCSFENRPSCLLAEKISFRLDGRELYFCYYAKE